MRLIQDVGGRKLAGEKLKAWRRSKGWTQAELAERTGWGNRIGVALIETGHRSLCVELVQRCMRLGIDANWLLNDEPLVPTVSGQP